MNNFAIGLKRFFKNKNVITVLLVIAILVVLYIGYSTSIKSKTDPVNIPVASKTIGPEKQITGEDVQVVTVARSMVTADVIQNANMIIGKYTNINVTIPKGSMFFNSWLTEADKIPGNWIEELDHDAGENAFYLPVNINTTFGNSIKPNTYIDIYVKAEDENGTMIFGKLLKNIKVLVVHDSSGRNVFDDEEGRVPANLGFALSQDLYVLLSKAQSLNLDLIVAPKGYTVPTENYVIVTSSTLRDFIDAQTITAEEDATTQNTTNPANPTE